MVCSKLGATFANDGASLQGSGRYAGRKICKDQSWSSGVHLLPEAQRIIMPGSVVPASLRNTGWPLVIRGVLPIGRDGLDPPANQHAEMS